MIDWLLYILPWWVKVGAGLVLAGVILKIFGWKASAAALITVATLGLVNRGQQQGWEARINKDIRDADKAIERARAARADADYRNADPDQLRKPDRYKRDQ